MFPLLLYGLVLILSVETPDMEADRRGGKLTWIVRKGRGFGFTLAGISLLAATVYFFLLHGLSPLSLPLDFRVLGLLSLIALGPGLYGLMKRPLRREPASRAAVWTLLALGVFSIAADGYLFLLAAR
jgi:1,4-dihydroxy-2-naphthoate octaprenyltransferase